MRPICFKQNLQARSAPPPSLRVCARVARAIYHALALAGKAGRQADLIVSHSSALCTQGALPAALILSLR